MFKKIIGSKQFYVTVIAITLPIMLQQAITSIVGLLDNIMVGSLNQDAIAGVAVANQIMFVAYIGLIGGMAGPGIYIAQFNGANNKEGLRQTFRVKVQFAIILTFVAIAIYLLFGNRMIASFLTTDGITSTEAVKQGVIYLYTMLVALVPFAISQVFASTFREIGKTKVPMIAGIIAVLINLFLNYALILGNFGFPRLEVLGAGIATIIARVIEMGFLIVTAYYYKYQFAVGQAPKLTIKSNLFRSIIKKGTPLLINELLWATGMALLLLAYSYRGDIVPAAFSISNATANLFYIIFGALATGISIMVGNELGANRLQEARDNAYKLLAFAVFICLVSGIFLLGLSYVMPMIYNVPQETRDLASSFMRVIALCLPIFAFNAGCFFILRAGGATKTTLIFDAVYVWAIAIPLAFGLSYLTGLPIILVYLIVQLAEIIKSFFGSYLIRKGIWIKNLTTDKEETITLAQ
ncbi:MAG TPA: MATE family efflux transporter [Bacilli bacterium]|nr:MATE family efflux transporter [Bacilli bacterium]